MATKKPARKAERRHLRVTLDLLFELPEAVDSIPKFFLPRCYGGEERTFDVLPAVERAFRELGLDAKLDQTDGAQGANVSLSGPYRRR